MEPEASLLCSQESRKCPYTKSAETSPHHHTLFFKINFNIVFPSVPWSSNWPVLLRSSKKYYCMLASSLPCTVRALPISTSLCHPDNIVSRVYIMKLPIMQLPLTCYFLPLWSKYSPQEPSVYVLSFMSETMIYIPYKTTAKPVILYTIFYFYIFR